MNRSANSTADNKWESDVFFSTQVKKKHKTFEEGKIMVDGSKLTLFNEEGEKVISTIKPKKLNENWSDPFVVGTYYIEPNKKSEPVFKKPNSVLSQPLTPSKSGLKPYSALSSKQKLLKPLTHTIRPTTEGFKLCDDIAEEKQRACYLETFLSDRMREHQRVGVKFMFECITGLRGDDIQGCILADSMGLGKTVQTIALIWTLLKQSPHADEQKSITRAIVVTPLTVVKNWEKEFKKWLGSTRLQPLVVLGNREDVSKTVISFVKGQYRCLIIAFECFRNNLTALKESGADLLVIDEGHKLKNMFVKTFQDMMGFPCKHRILLTGTPLQNSLEELYSCCNFVNPGIFTSLPTFKKLYAGPILRFLQNEGDLEDTLDIGKERSKELTSILSRFILRRTENLLTKFLPPKTEVLVFVKMTDVQMRLYRCALIALLNSDRETLARQRDKVFSDDYRTGDSMSLIMCLRKILNNPLLLRAEENTEFARDMSYLLPTGSNFKVPELYSHKFLFLKQILECLEEREKIVICSYFNQTLDLVEVLLKNANFKWVRIDGTVMGTERQSKIDIFNNRDNDIKVCLICGKAGGVGINLIAANRMIMFEVDWNPSNDAQVMARIWREGQIYPVYIYRLVSCGTIEERMLQRQIMKEKLTRNIVDSSKDQKITFDIEEIRKIFEFRDDEVSLTVQPEENELTTFMEENMDIKEDMVEYIRFIKTRTTGEVKLDEERKMESDGMPEESMTSMPKEKDENSRSQDENSRLANEILAKALNFATAEKSEMPEKEERKTPLKRGFAFITNLRELKRPKLNDDDD